MACVTSNPTFARLRRLDCPHMHLRQYKILMLILTRAIFNPLSSDTQCWALWCLLHCNQSYGCLCCWRCVNIGGMEKCRITWRGYGEGTVQVLVSQAQTTAVLSCGPQTFGILVHGICLIRVHGNFHLKS